MANQLDELNPGNLPDDGVGTRVIAKRIPVTVGLGTKVFEFLLWVPFIIPGLIFQLAKVKAKEHFQQLEQTIQHNASTIDNYMDQRVQVLQNCARLLDRAEALDMTVFQKLAETRSYTALSDSEREGLEHDLAAASRCVSIAVEAYPDLRSHEEIKEAMRQNLYLQREITAARELYNDSIAAWNHAIFIWPAKQIVAAKEGYTTRIPFAAPKPVIDESNSIFF